MTARIDALAANVRRLRASHGFSLSQLSERSGIAKATLFKVERGGTNPTLDTLSAIADTFDTSVEALIAMQPEVMVDVLHPGEGQDISDTTSVGQILRQQVIGPGLLEIHTQTFAAGKVETSASHGSGSREHVFVRAGTISLGPVSREVTVAAGDYITYPADGMHRWEALDGDASVWIVHTFPRSTPFVDG